MPGSILAGLALDSTLTGGTQETQVVDAAGNPVGTQDNGGIRGLAVTQSGTYYSLSTGNSSTAQLAAAATFTGTIEYSANQQAISILCTSDQNMTLTVNQFIDADGTRQSSTQSFSVLAGVGFSRCLQLNGNYYRVTLQNNGGSTTTTLNLDVALGTLQSQTQSGNLPVSISELASDRTATFSIAANNTNGGEITGLQGASTATVQLTGTFTATAQIQVTRDGSNWLNVTGSNVIVNMATGAYVASGNLTAAGLYQCDVSGCVGVRVRTTAYTSGTMVGAIAVTAAQGMVTVSGTPAVTVASGTITTVSTVTTCSTVTTVGSVTSANLGIPSSIADVASAALTTTTTTSAFTPTFGTSHIVSVPVTAVSGTTPTLDISVEESDDAGTNWRTVYQFPRITATGIYRSPKLPLSGNRVRYVQTVAGTTPSFTRAINRLQCSDSVSVYRQLYDRAVSLTTLNATTAALDVQGCSGVQLTINLGAATTAPTLVLEATEDGGASWYTLATLLGVASSTVAVAVPGVSPQSIRARVSVVGATVTAGYVQLRGY
jgi:hypothetical protein